MGSLSAVNGTRDFTSIAHSCQTRYIRSRSMLVGTITIGLIPSAIILVFINLEHLFTYLSSKSSQVKPVVPELRALAFIQGRSRIWNHPFLLGFASARSISPSVFAEYLHNGKFQSSCLCLIRLLALMLCIFFWRYLFVNKYDDAGQFLRYRFRSQILSFLFNCNVILGSLYIYKSMASPMINTFVEFFKANCFQNVIFTVFLLVTSLGGFSVTMFAVAVHAVLDLLGKILFFTSISSIKAIGKEFWTTPFPPCYANLAIGEFIPVLSLILTVLPIYNILRTAKNIQQMTLSAIISMLVLVYDHLWLTVISSKIKEIGTRFAEGQKNIENNTSLWLRLLLEQIGGDLKIDLGKKRIKWSQADEFWNFSPLAASVYFWSFTAPLNAFSALQMHALTLHLIENCIPTWFRQVVVSSMRELRVVYTFVRFLLSVLLVITIEMSMAGTPEVLFKGKVLFVPMNESALTTAVCSVVLTGWALEGVDSRVLIVLAFLQTVALFYLRRILFVDLQIADFSEDEHYEWVSICFAAWAPTIAAVTMFVVLIPSLAASSRSRRLPIRETETDSDLESSEDGTVASVSLVELYQGNAEI